MKKEIACLAIDDEPRALDVLNLYCQEVPFLEMKATFTSGIKALDYLVEHPVDLVFLDINMPKISGLKIAEILDHKTKIIFTTAYSEHAVKSYELEVLDYLLKPITFERFLKAVMKLNKTTPSQAETSTANQDCFVYIKSGHELHRVNSEEILFIESDGNYARFYFETHFIMARYSMVEAMELLPNSNFVRSHKTYIVNKKHIKVIDRSFVRLDKHEKGIPIGKKYRDGFLAEVVKE